MNPAARYTKLYFHPDATVFMGPTTRIRPWSIKGSIKVDILVPGALQIPHFPPHHIKHVKPLNIPFTFPVVPSALLIIMKLHAWSQCRAASSQYFFERQYKHKADLDALIAIAQIRKLIKEVCPFIPRRIIGRGRRQVGEYIKEFPDSKIGHVWADMRFQMPRRAISTRTKWSS
jgi:hypothetical protein